MIDVALSLIGIGFILVALVLRLSKANNDHLIILFLGAGLLSFILSTSYIAQNWNTFSNSQINIGGFAYSLTLTSFYVFMVFVVVSIIIYLFNIYKSYTK